MDIGDPHAWAEGAVALKTAFDLFRSAVGLVRDSKKAIGHDDAQAKAADEALDEALKAAGLAEALIAKALGYELCKCAYPPTAMLTVGYKAARGQAGSGPVFECPKCGYDNASPFGYTRIAPRREAKQP
jgi:hypothetical protein